MSKATRQHRQHSRRDLIAIIERQGKALLEKDRELRLKELQIMRLENRLKRMQITLDKRIPKRSQGGVLLADD